MAEAQAYTHPSLSLPAWEAASTDPAVLIADGSNVKVTVRAGHLSISDGPPGQLRERRVPKQPRTCSRLVLLGGHGYVTVEALRWLSGAQIPWTAVDPYSGAVVGMSSPAREDAALLRLQVQAKDCDGGIDIAKYLIRIKLGGQADNARDIFRDSDAESFIRERISEVAQADSIGAVLAAEGRAAQAYWAMWGRVAVPWSSADRARVPEHWLCWQGRASLMHVENGTAVGPSVNKDSTCPINACLNYAYAVAETQATIALRSVGLAPVLGWLHNDRLGRAAASLDLLETIRPAVDRIILSMMMIDGELPAQRFDRRFVSEGISGIVRIMPPLSHKLCSYSAQLAAALQPHAVQIVRILTGAPAPKTSGRKLNGTPSAHRGYPRNRLAPGIRLTDVLPDALWDQIIGLLPPRRGAGRPLSMSERDYLAAMLVRYALGCPWNCLPRSLHTSTVNDQLRRLQKADVWQKIVSLFNEHGHAPTLIM